MESEYKRTLHDDLMFLCKYFREMVGDTFPSCRMTEYHKHPINNEKIEVPYLTFEDFDPIFRKKEFQDVRKGAYRMVGERKKYQEYHSLIQRRQAQYINRQSYDQYVDQDELDFRADDPRKKALDANQEKQ